MPVEFDVQRTIKTAEIWTLFSDLSELSVPAEIYSDNRGVVHALDKVKPSTSVPTTEMLTLGCESGTGEGQVYGRSSPAAYSWCRQGKSLDLVSQICWVTTSNKLGKRLKNPSTRRDPRKQICEQELSRCFHVTGRRVPNLRTSVSASASYMKKDPSWRSAESDTVWTRKSLRCRTVRMRAMMRQVTLRCLSAHCIREKKEDWTCAKAKLGSSMKVRSLSRARKGRQGCFILSLIKTTCKISLSGSLTCRTGMETRRSSVLKLSGRCQEAPNQHTIGTNW